MNDIMKKETLAEKEVKCYTEKGAIIAAPFFWSHEVREAVKNVLEEIEKKIIFYKRLWMDAVGNKNKHQEDIFYNVYRNLCDIKIIIKSEFGDFESEKNSSPVFHI